MSGTEYADRPGADELSASTFKRGLDGELTYRSAWHSLADFLCVPVGRLASLRAAELAGLIEKRSGFRRDYANGRLRGLTTVKIIVLRELAAADAARQRHAAARSIAAALDFMNDRALMPGG